MPGGNTARQGVTSWVKGRETIKPINAFEMYFIYTLPELSNQSPSWLKLTGGLMEQRKKATQSMLKANVILRKVKPIIRLTSNDLPRVIEFNGKKYRLRETPKNGLQLT
jgi:hypothetical protein